MEAIKQKEVLKYIIIWNVEIGRKQLIFGRLPVRGKEYHCIELGSSKGGMSLWLFCAFVDALDIPRFKYIVIGIAEKMSVIARFLALD